MAGRNNGRSNLVALGDFRSNAQIAMYKITPAVALTASTRATVDGEEIKTVGTAEQVITELAPLMYEVKSDGSILYVTVDGHAWSAAAIERLVENVTGGNDTVALIETFEN